LDSFLWIFGATARAWMKVTNEEVGQQSSVGAVGGAGGACGMANGRVEMRKRAEMVRCGGGRIILFR
jgi:tripartite-type tricarboxylate transporter receptor subunit TctC